MTELFGRIVQVSAHVFGSELTDDVSAGADTITVADSTDFDEDGGTLLLIADDGSGTEEAAYTTVDDDTGDITLDGTLVSGFTADDRVEVVPRALEREAWVQIDGDEAEAIVARVPHHLHSLVAEGVRSDDEQESVEVRLDGLEWVVVGVFGLQPAMKLTGRQSTDLPVMTVDESDDGQWGAEPGVETILFGNMAEGEFPGQLVFGRHPSGDTFIGTAELHPPMDDLDPLDPGPSVEVWYDTSDQSRRVLLLAGPLSSGGTSDPTEVDVAADEIFLVPNYQAHGYAAHHDDNRDVSPHNYGNGVMYGGVTQLTNVPSSITLSGTGFADGAGITGVSAGQITVRGFKYLVTIAAASNAGASRHYVTVGN